jgi:hypothetical protein
MKRYTYTGFYGDYGTIIVHNDGRTTLTMNFGMRTEKRRYKSFTGAKIALGRMSDSYTIKEVKERV